MCCSCTDTDKALVLITEALKGLCGGLKVRTPAIVRSECARDAGAGCALTYLGPRIRSTLQRLTKRSKTSKKTAAAAGAAAAGAAAGYGALRDRPALRVAARVLPWSPWVACVLRV